MRANHFLLLAILLWTITLLSPPSAASDHYLETVAYLPHLPDEPNAFDLGLALQQMNNRGDVLFTLRWRSPTSNFRSVIFMSAPGQAQPRRLVSGGDPVNEFPGVVLTGGGEPSSRGNFVEVTSNANGEVLFLAGVVGKGGTQATFGGGFFKVGSQGMKLLGPFPGTDPNFVFPFAVGGLSYSPAGRLQWGDARGFRIADSGEGYFVGDIHEYANFRLNLVLTGGLFEIGRSDAIRLIAYPNGPTEDPINWNFQNIAIRGVGQKNGAMVLETTLYGVSTNSNIGQTKRVFYRFHNNVLQPIHTEGAPLPDLPPTEPVDPLVNLVDTDDTGNILFSARSRIGGRALGYWKWTTNGLAKVLGWEEEASTTAGPIRILAPINILDRAVIGNGRAVFLADFTGLGYTNATRGLFKENGTNLTLLAVPGMRVTENNYILGTDLPALWK